MKMPGRCTGPQFSVKKIREMAKAPSGRTRLGQKNGQTGRGINMVQKVFWIREAKNGTKAGELV